MSDIETIIRKLYSVAEGDTLDMETFVSSFSIDGYMTDIPAELTLRGKDIGAYLTALTAAFPDIHRELFSMHFAGNVAVVELAIRGTHTGGLALPSGKIAPTGRAINVPCCDVFHVEDGKVTSFHCYNAASIMQKQLGIVGS
jgi:ketosteroid isomerase-like protein